MSIDDGSDTIVMMDEAAKKAEEQIKNIDQETIKPIANWWKKNYMKAGHKRLAKVLLKYAE